jgi:hypothetical protein
MYEKVMENGMQKKTVEPYLVDALSFTEAEARIIEETRPIAGNGLVVADIKKMKIAELFFNPSGDRYYKVKVQFIALDEKSGAEKRTTVQMLAQASDIKDAIAVVEQGMKGTLADYVISSINETAIMDVFPFSSQEKTTTN